MKTETWQYINGFAVDVPLPKTLVVDERGDIYAGCCGQKGALLKYAPDGELLWRRDAGRVKGLSLCPAGGVFYTAEKEMQSQAGQMDASGELRSECRQIRTLLANPQGIATGEDGYLYVLECSRWSGKDLQPQSSHRIHKFDASACFLSSWGEEGYEPGRINMATDLALGPDDRIYLADSYNNRVQVFSPEGELEACWGEEGNGPGQLLTPQGITVDSNNRVFVADTYNHRVQVFTSEGDYLDSWGQFGSQAGDFWLPCGVALDSTGKVYVADTINDRIDLFAEKKGEESCR